MTIIIIYMCIGIIINVASLASQPDIMEEVEKLRRHAGFIQFAVAMLIAAAMWPAVVFYAIWEHFKG